MKAVGYARVSTDEQAREGVSLEAQVAKIRSYADLHDLELVCVFLDAGVSGGTALGERDGGSRVMELVRADEVDAVIVHKLDRLGRRTLDVLALVEELQDRGVALHSITEKLDTESAIGRFVLRTLASLAEMERDQVRERTQLAMRHKAAQGHVVSRAPRGLRIVDRQLAPDPESDGIAMYARAKALRDRGWTYRAIASRLTEEGFRPRRRDAGHAIAPEVVRYMLANPRLKAAYGEVV